MLSVCAIRDVSLMLAQCGPSSTTLAITLNQRWVYDAGTTLDEWFVFSERSLYLMILWLKPQSSLRPRCWIQSHQTSSYPYYDRDIKYYNDGIMFRETQVVLKPYYTGLLSLSYYCIIEITMQNEIDHVCEHAHVLTHTHIVFHKYLAVYSLYIILIPISNAIFSNFVKLYIYI